MKKKKIFNIDIHFDYAMSVLVRAHDLDEAIEIVKKQLEDGTIKPTDAEPTGDCDLNTNYQPDEPDYQPDEPEPDVAYDKNGNEIHTGDRVIWVDPEDGRRVEYQVYDENPTSDMVKLANEHGECEAYPEDCIVIK